MTVFRVISGIVIAVLIAGMAYDARRRMKSWKAAGGMLRRQFRNSLRRTGKTGGIASARRFFVIVSTVFFLILAITGFLPVIFLGIHLSGLLLVIHVTVAPLFAVSLSALALLWAHRLRFDRLDWQIAVGSGARESYGSDNLVRFMLKVGFWLILPLSLPLMLTIILSLFPLFGTEGEELLIRLHGYSALLLMAAALCEIYVLIAYKEKNP